MTNYATLIKRGRDKWNRWREENPSETPSIRAHLAHHDFTGYNLHNVDFEGSYIFSARFDLADLSGANLREANLRGSTFTKAILDNSNLQKAGLLETYFLTCTGKGANFSEAGLHAASFRRSKLDGAIFRNAALNDTLFSQSDVRSSDFSGATFASTILADVDMRGAIGLDSCHHARPSHVNRENFERSGPISTEFLRKCGFKDWEIEVSKLYQEGLTHQQVTDVGYKLVNIFNDDPIKYFSCFISYGHSDKFFAQQLYDRLQARGIRCWLDEKHLLPGDDIFEQIDHGIRLWDKVLLCCSESSLNSWWVDNEVITALEKEQRLMKERRQKINILIPLNIDGYMFGEHWRRGYKKQILSRFAPDFTGWREDASKLKRGIERVILGLRADEHARETPPPPLL